MTVLPDHQRAAMTLISSGAALSPKEGSFLGQLAFDPKEPTEKQARWLDILVRRYGPSGEVKP